MHNYNPEWHRQRKEFTYQNFVEMSGYSKEQVIRLTGIRGYKIANSRRRPKLYVDGIYPVLQVIVIYPGIKLYRFFDLQCMQIRNSSFELEKIREGTGTNVLKSQIEEALKIGFVQISCRAQGDKNQPSNGYITWGRLGYSMRDIPERNEVIRNLSKNSKMVTLFPDLTKVTIFSLLQTADGKVYWKDEGRSWWACFSTMEPSPNVDDVNTYLKEKSIEPLISF